jgi:hypothetical protein
MYKTIKTRKIELKAILNYKKDREEFDADYYSKMVELMDLYDEIEIVEFINYILKKFKKES